MYSSGRGVTSRHPVGFRKISPGSKISPGNSYSSSSSRPQNHSASKPNVPSDCRSCTTAVAHAIGQVIALLLSVRAHVLLALSNRPSWRARERYRATSPTSKVYTWSRTPLKTFGWSEEILKVLPMYSETK